MEATNVLMSSQSPCYPPKVSLCRPRFEKTEPWISHIPTDREHCCSIHCSRALLAIGRSVRLRFSFQSCASCGPARRRSEEKGELGSPIISHGVTESKKNLNSSHCRRRNRGSRCPSHCRHQLHPLPAALDPAQSAPWLETACIQLERLW